MNHVFVLSVVIKLKIYRRRFFGLFAGGGGVSGVSSGADCFSFNQDRPCMNDATIPNALAVRNANATFW
jgi:hypothetical protein